MVQGLSVVEHLTLSDKTAPGPNEKPGMEKTDV